MLALRLWFQEKMPAVLVETAEEILNKLTELIEIADMKTALEQIQDAKDKNNSLYWILYKIVNR